MLLEYALEPLQASHRYNVLEIISAAFSRDDPLARSQRIDADDFRAMIVAGT